MAESPPDDQHLQVLQYQNQYEEEKVTFYLDSLPAASPEEIQTPPGGSIHSPGGSTHSPGGTDVVTTDGAAITPPHGGDKSVAQILSSRVAPFGSGNKTGETAPGGKDSTAQVVQEEEEIRFIDEDGDSQFDDDPASVLLPGDRGSEASPEQSNSEQPDSEKSQGRDDELAQTTAHTPTKEEIMTKFEETEKIFREKFLSPSLMDLSVEREAQMPSAVSSLSPIDVSSSAERLEHLVKVLEQLSYLRHQNEQLRRKCVFLEDTRYLLQVQNDMLMARDHGRSRTLFKQNQRMMQFFDTATSKMGLDMTPIRTHHMRHPSESSDILLHSTPQDKGGKLVRSQSDGSLDLVDMEFSIESAHESSHTTSVEKTTTSPTTREYFMSRADFHKKSRKLQQKWERVKKVFSGKPEHSTKPDAVSAEQLVQANTSKPPEKDRPPDLENLPKPGILLVGASTEEAPPTPNSIQSEPPEVHAHSEQQAHLEDVATAGKLKRSHSADSITSGSSNANQRFVFDDRSLSNQSQCSLDRTRYLRLEGRLERRRSSPTLSIHDNDKDYITVPGGTPRLIRSSSMKLMKSSTDLDMDGQSGKRVISSDAAKKAKAAWVRVKDIIHTRKDSLKKGKPHRVIGHAMSDGEISPDITLETRFHIGDGSETESRPSRDRTRRLRSAGGGKSSPLRPRHRTVGPGTVSPARKFKRQSLAHVMLSNAPGDVAALMGITDDFNKRMQEWEEKKKRGLIKANSFSYDIESGKTFDSSSTKFTEDFIKKMEEWEQMKGLTSPPKSPDPEKEIVKMEPVVASDCQGKVPLQNLSESFSKTVQEWERVKERRAREGTSPGPESRGRERNIERSKSRERDRSRHKFEKEIQKIERKEWKIEREKQKLERMKMKLDMAMESSSGSEGFGDGLTFESMKKHLQEKETRAATLQQTETKMTTLKHHSETTVTSEETSAHHARSMSTKESSSEIKLINRERVFSDSCIQVLPTQRSMSFDPFSGMSESPPEQGAMAMLAAPSRDVRGKSSETDDSGTLQHMASSEESTTTLLRQIDDKDEQIKDLQYDVQQLTDRISLMDREQTQKIEGYKRQLKASNRMGQFVSQSHQMDASLRELRAQVDVLIQAQDILVKEKQALQKKLQASVDEYESSKTQYLSMIQSLQEKVDLTCSTRGDQPRPTVTALCGLINQAQDQLSRLQHTLSSRTSTIHDLERHLLTQKVNNKLLEAGLQRQALEIGYLREQKRKRIIKRSKTFSGHDLCIRQDGRLELKQDKNSQDDSKYYYSLSKQRPISPHASITTDSTTFDLHSGWLEAIQKQLDEESRRPSPPPAAAAPVGVTAECQTAVTLLNCPRLSMPGDGSDQSAVHPTSAPPEELIQLKAVATQTTREEQQEVVAVVATVTDVIVPVVTATCEAAHKAGILKSSPRPGGRSPERRTRGKGMSQTRRETAIRGRPSTSSQSHPSTSSQSRPSTSSQSDEGAAGGDMKRHSYQEWLKREPKPLILDMTRTGSLDVPDSAERSQISAHDSDEVFSSKEELPSSRGENKPTAQHLLDPEDSSGPHLPHSPVIRSKNVRKLKNTDSRIAAITGDARTWKATPPRRFIRHRKNIVERLSIGAVLSEDEHILEREAEAARLRTKSDSSELTRACAIARENSMKRKKGDLSGSGERISIGKNLLEVHSYVSRHTARSSSGVRDMISKYEEGKFRKSPSPSVPKFSVMSPKRLKTAAELIQESIDRKHHRTAELMHDGIDGKHRTRSSSVTDKYSASSPPLGREKLTSTSSDKENSRSSRSRSQAVIRQQLSLDSPLNGARNSPKSAIRSLGYSLNSEEQGDSQELARPLKDVTNDNTELDCCVVSQEHPPNLGVAVSTSKSETATLPVPTAPPRKHHATRTQKRTDPVKSASGLEPSSARHMSKGDSTDSQSTWSCRSSEQDDSCTETGSPWYLAKEPNKTPPDVLPGSTKSERKSRSKSKARFWSKERFFDKRAKSQSPSRAGAISALCMQTMTLSVEDDSSDSQHNVGASPPVPSDVLQDAPQSPESDKRSRRQKFLDSNWFQKPKGIFRVSKC